MTEDAHTHLVHNPFYVLELPTDCSRAQVERAGQKLLAMLDLDMRGADAYPSPHGGGTRDMSKVRVAMAELRDPQRRLVHELWVSPTSSPDPDPGAPPDLSGAVFGDTLDDAAGGFTRARNTLGWR